MGDKLPNWEGVGVQGGQDGELIAVEAAENKRLHPGGISTPLVYPKKIARKSIEGR